MGNGTVGGASSSQPLPGGSIADGTITNFEMGPNSVDTSQLIDSAVTNAKVADNAVTSGKLASASVTAEKVADKAITAEKFGALQTYTHNVQYGPYTTGSNTTSTYSNIVLPSMSIPGTGTRVVVVVQATGEFYVASLNNSVQLTLTLGPPIVNVNVNFRGGGSSTTVTGANVWQQSLMGTLSAGIPDKFLTDSNSISVVGSVSITSSSGVPSGTGYFRNINVRYLVMG
jgi:hypothetical protein